MSDQETREWGRAKRFGFRFALTYFVLYYLPFPFDLIPKVDDWISLRYENVWHAIVRFVARHLFNREITVFTNGSGDTTYDYIRVACTVVIALALTIAWTWRARRLSHPRLFDWLRVYLRFALAGAMISYGAGKIFPYQFPQLALDDLARPFGSASPMGLLWNFMGASPAYGAFSGLAELIGGILLTLRRTTLLGALISAAVLAHIVTLNFCYDVPVKLYSSHLFLTAVILALPDLRRLIDMFILNRRVEPTEIRPLFANRFSHVSTLLGRSVLVALFIGQCIIVQWNDYSGRVQQRAAADIRGIWEVEEFMWDGQARPPIAADRERWRRVIFDRAEILSIQRMNDERQRYFLPPADQKPGMIVLLTGPRDPNNPGPKSTLQIMRVDPTHLVLQGQFDGHDLRASLHKMDERQFLLTTRGFHWINEYPFNR